jgi:hypothetical protein
MALCGESGAALISSFPKARANDVEMGECV